MVILAAENLVSLLFIPSWSLRSASPAPSELLTQLISYLMHGEFSFLMNMHLIFKLFFFFVKSLTLFNHLDCFLHMKAHRKDVLHLYF